MKEILLINEKMEKLLLPPKRQTKWRSRFVKKHSLNFALSYKGKKEANPVFSEDGCKLADELIKHILEYAAFLGASDAHIEPYENNIKIRFRVNGVFKSIASIPSDFYPVILNRFKVMARLNLAEKRKPQDGSLIFEKGDARLSVRISTMPTVYGEKIVLRMLKRQNDEEKPPSSAAGSYENISEIVKNCDKGIILLSGPTGSGKTSTLYSIFEELKNSKMNLVTIEDPVESRIDDVTQIQVEDKAGLTFPVILRSVLRQDPDTIMIGEIRDSITAQIAISAAMTGHLIVSTVHANDAVSIISRLVHLGIAPYFIAENLTMLISQRLIGNICPVCRENYEASAYEAGFLEVDLPFTLSRGTGCEACHFTGYAGRFAIYEILNITPAIRRLIEKKAAHEDINKQAEKEGMKTLFETGRSYVLKGVVSFENFRGNL